MRTHVIGNRIEIEGTLVAVLDEGAYAGRHLDLVALLDEAGKPDTSLERIEGTLDTLAKHAEAVSARIDHVVTGEKSFAVPDLVAKFARAIDGLPTHGNEPLDDAIAGVRNMLESLCEWLKAQPVTPAVTEAYADEGTTPDAADDEPLSSEDQRDLSWLLEVAEGQLAKMTAEREAFARENQVLRSDLASAQHLHKQLTRQMGDDAHARLVEGTDWQAEFARLKAQSDRQSDEIKRLTAAMQAKVSPSAGGPKNQMGFDAAASRLYLHLQGQAHRLDPATQKLVAAVGKSL